MNTFVYSNKIMFSYFIFSELKVERFTKVYLKYVLLYFTHILLFVTRWYVSILSITKIIYLYHSIIHLS